MFVFSKILTLFLIKAFKYKIQVYKNYGNNTNPVTKSTETNKFKIRVF